MATPCFGIARPSLEKDETMEELRRFMVSEGSEWWLMLSGHGDRGGRFVLGRETLVLDEVADAWLAACDELSRTGVTLFILNDSCHSGWWVHQLRAWQAHTYMCVYAARARRGDSYGLSFGL